MLVISRSNGRKRIAIRMKDTVKATRVCEKLDSPHSKGPVLSAYVFVSEKRIFTIRRANPTTGTSSMKM
jgi:hypothetical protein